MPKIKINNHEIFVDEGERFFQINDISGEALTTLWPTLVTRYEGFDVNLCFRDMPAPEEALARIGATVLEDCVRFIVTPQTFTPCKNPADIIIEPLSLENDADFNAFAALHDALPDMFWTSQRVREKWDIWRVFILREGEKITGYALLRLYQDETSETYAVEARTQAHRTALFSTAAQCAFDNGKTNVIEMVERDNIIEERDALHAVGFAESGYYKGYEALCK
ncbi:MAG: hypothetical protein FWC16_07370 [Defluviitaleaceae bacterium]|nr:hypothetical protein [Defluviitaleaceae bacterium]MCL2274733.1 hypothetical protein [Defluviitaleaceae bacterium]